MTRYELGDTVVDTESSTDYWREADEWDGSNYIGRSTGSPHEHEFLYRSTKGRYYVEFVSNWEGRQPSARWVSPEEATRWLLLNDHVVPEDLAQYIEAVTE